MAIVARPPFARLTQAVTGVLERLRSLFARDAYRPEQHYMHGPGPKLRARAVDRSSLALPEE